MTFHSFSSLIGRFRTAIFGYFVVAKSQAECGWIVNSLLLPRRSYPQKNPADGLSSLSSISKDDLERLTVKDLRQLLKESSNLERGLMSKLKRKQEIIQYLQSASSISLPTNHSLQDSREIPSSESTVEVLTSTKKSPRIRRMPPLLRKDDFYDLLYERYPPLRNETLQQGLADDDIRQSYHPIMRSNRLSDFDLVTIGTASCSPGITRGVSCTALRLNWQRRYVPSTTGTSRMQPTTFQGGTWMFDVGECTQLQVQRTNRIRAGKITKIFVTHAHGDHTFGLPGLLCLMGQDRDRDDPPLDIYGPEGLRLWLRMAIRYSVSRIVPNYRVHEIMNIPMAPEWRYSRQTNRYFYQGTQSGSNTESLMWKKHGLAGEDPESWITQAGKIHLESSLKFGELDGGRNIYPQYNHPKAFGGAPVWEVEDEGDVKVYAAPMSHGVPCLGYVIEEQDRPGRLRSEFVEPIVLRNMDALKDCGFKIPMKAMAVIKNLPEGSAFTFPDGTVVTQEDAVEPPRAGRKVVICGDTADARALTNLAMNADVVVHEATNAYLEFLDKDSADMVSVMRDSASHGHSTPQMAGEFAKRVNAQRLIMNHFSPRYKGDQAIDSISIMTQIEMQAIEASGLNEEQVVSAWDFMLLPLPSK